MPGLEKRPPSGLRATILPRLPKKPATVVAFGPASL